MDEPMYREIPKHNLPPGERMTAMEKKLKDELKNYRSTHGKPWYLQNQKPQHGDCAN